MILAIRLAPRAVFAALALIGAQAAIAATPKVPAVTASVTTSVTAGAATTAAAATPAGGSAATPATAVAAAKCPAFLDQEFTRLRSAEKVNLCKAFAGKPLLVVNTASHCGFTPQFKGLEALNQKYRGRGLVVLGFPSDDFNQEAKDQAETAEVCYVNYGVKFAMFAPTVVSGSKANPLFRELARQSQEPSWNFNKYLVAADGKVVGYFGSRTAPDSPEMQAAIEKLL
ncbi:MAG: glutathione peroxidase [Gammaproteobacteria bacterium]|nr:glutathione peroxidase [Gammaproteobacteria bacterium]